MKEKDLRKWHRNLGICLGILIILQAGSGLVLSLVEGPIPEAHGNGDSKNAGGEGEHDESIIEEAMEAVHTEGGALGFIYRLIVGTGMLLMTCSGGWIFMKIRARSA